MKNATTFIVLSLLLAARGVWACNSPLVLDLDGNGIINTTSAWWDPVLFDIDADGLKEATGWPSPYTGEGLLAIDLNNNGWIDNGRELFGDATLLPTGGTAQHGFEALALYDASEMGGNGDGRIDHSDLVWHYLRIWIDENLDGASQRKEVRPLSAWGVVGLSLLYETAPRVDGSMNVHQFVGTYLKRFDGREGRFEIRPMLMEDIFFRVSQDPVSD